ncbi:Pycsar system effector family protein, partial [Mariniphaga sediminis]|uniref:Pycsar system effector family protein n=1 Tax=Mariniphaga sediminis TaxID=1628158 RepID=UPI0035675381
EMIRFHLKVNCMEKERLKFCIERFDHYYDSINNKSAVFLGLGTFVIGGLIAIYPYLNDHVQFSNLIWFFLLMSIVLAFAAILVLITASTPYLSKGEKSMYYFNSIAEKEANVFINESKNFSEKEELPDLRIQAHCLAMGLRRKFKRLRIAAILFTLMFLSMLPLFILILLNFKN